MILNLPVASRERIMLRLHEAESAAGKRPSRIVLNPRDYDRLLLDMRRYGFFPSKYRPRLLQVLNVPIDCDDIEETAPDDNTVRFEWSE
ncbi:MAG: hypothetical protein KGL39_59625 [Patescibacteria group bacterium]|nr:hypothetical protein [Patescibacteria group bacterium]